MKREFYKMYYEDWDEGVECFGAGEPALMLQGAYLCLCNQMYRRGGGIPDDAAILAKYLGVSPTRARTIVKTLIKHNKLVATSGQLINERAAAELRHRRDLAATRSQSGSLGGRPQKVERNQQCHKASENQMPSSPSTLLSSPLLSDTDSVSYREVDGSLRPELPSDRAGRP